MKNLLIERTEPVLKQFSERTNLNCIPESRAGSLLLDSIFFPLKEAMDVLIFTDYRNHFMEDSFEYIEYMYEILALEKPSEITKLSKKSFGNNPEGNWMDYLYLTGIKRTERDAIINKLEEISKIYQEQKESKLYDSKLNAILNYDKKNLVDLYISLNKEKHPDEILEDLIKIMGINCGDNLHVPETHSTFHIDSKDISNAASNPTQIKKEVMKRDGRFAKYVKNISLCLDTLIRNLSNDNTTFLKCLYMIYIMDQSFHIMKHFISNGHDSYVFLQSIHDCIKDLQDEDMQTENFSISAGMIGFYPERNSCADVLSTECKEIENTILSWAKKVCDIKNEKNILHEFFSYLCNNSQVKGFLKEDYLRKIIIALHKQYLEFADNRVEYLNYLYTKHPDLESAEEKEFKKQYSIKRTKNNLHLKYYFSNQKNLYIFKENQFYLEDNPLLDFKFKSDLDNVFENSYCLLRKFSKSITNISKELQDYYELCREAMANNNNADLEVWLHIIHILDRLKTIQEIYSMENREYIYYTPYMQVTEWKLFFECLCKHSVYGDADDKRDLKCYQAEQKHCMQNFLKRLRSSKLAWLHNPIIEKIDC